MFILEVRNPDSSPAEQRFEKYFFWVSISATQPLSKGDFPYLDFNSSVGKG